MPFKPIMLHFKCNLIWKNLNTSHFTVKIKLWQLLQRPVNFPPSNNVFSVFHMFVVDFMVTVRYYSVWSLRCFSVCRWKKRFKTEKTSRCNCNAQLRWVVIALIEFDDAFLFMSCLISMSLSHGEDRTQGFGLRALWFDRANKRTSGWLKIIVWKKTFFL